MMCIMLLIFSFSDYLWVQSHISFGSNPLSLNERTSLYEKNKAEIFKYIQLNARKNIEKKTEQYVKTSNKSRTEKCSKLENKSECT